MFDTKYFMYNQGINVKQLLPQRPSSVKHLKDSVTVAINRL